MPSSCNVEPSYVKTFDGKYYDYSVNDCEHVVFAEESTRPRVVVTTKKNQQNHIVKLLLMVRSLKLRFPNKPDTLVVLRLPSRSTVKRRKKSLLLKDKTHHLIFRNKATGLCGDLNGEESSDLKTGRQCILSEAKLTGYSFMLKD